MLKIRFWRLVIDAFWQILGYSMITSHGST